MGWLYAGSTNEFYNSVCQNIPSDAVSIADAVFGQMMANLRAGGSVKNNNGQPEAVAPPGPALAQQAQMAIYEGLTLTLSGTLTLAGTKFPVDPATEAKLSAVLSVIYATGGFPGGASTMYMKDSAGDWHEFNLSQYKQICGALANYIYALQAIIDGNPMAATELPANSVSLALL